MQIEEMILVTVVILSPNLYLCVSFHAYVPI